MIDVIDPKNRYYVYTLAYPDGCVFYVGKGCGGRILHHEGEAQQGCDCKKCKIIRGIWESGKRVKRAIVFRTNDELEALTQERAAIERYGYEHLCNRNPRTQRIPADVLERRTQLVDLDRLRRTIEKRRREGYYANHRTPKRRNVRKRSE